jgi:phage terminase large subunit-like protein
MYVNNGGVDVTVFGGAAGSGKSEIGVIDFLKYTDIPGFIGVIVRRTTPQLKGPGGMLTKCKRYFQKVYGNSVQWKDKEGKFVFKKSGAEIYLRHFEHENATDNYQGIEANLFYLDEGTQFTLPMVQYIMSRMRNPSCPQVKPHLKISCNPDADHFLREWVDWYLLPDGTPNKEKDGKVRYFIFSSGSFIWADTKEELIANTGCEEKDCLSFTFISANVYSNPVVMKENPKYVAWLKGLKGTERARLLDGNWNVREEAAGLFKREWVEEVDFSPKREDVVKTVRAYDIAVTLKSDADPNPDYTTTVKMSKLKNGDYIIEDVVRFRARYGDVVKHILKTAHEDGAYVDIIIPKDPGSGGSMAATMLLNEIISEGFYARAKPTNKSKIERFKPFMAAAEHGLVKIVKRCADDLENKIYSDNNIYYSELEKFDGSRKNHDD